MFGLNWIKNKTVYQNLLELRGVSYTTAQKLCAFLGISKKTMFSELSYHKLEQINLVLSVYSKKTNPLLINKLSDLDPMFKPKCKIGADSQILKKVPSAPFGTTLLKFKQGVHSSGGNKAAIRQPKFVSQTRSRLGGPKRCRHTPILNALNTWTKERIYTLVSINTYRGRRLKLGYPSKGQRTKSNACTANRLNKGRCVF